jgi:hypothetical protein
MAIQFAAVSVNSSNSKENCTLFQNVMPDQKYYRQHMRRFWFYSVLEH